MEARRMKATRVFSYALFSLVVGASTAAYAQGEKDKKPDPQAAAKPGEQPPAKTPPRQAKKSAPPAHVQRAAQQNQRSQAFAGRNTAPARSANFADTGAKPSVASRPRENIGTARLSPRRGTTATGSD